MVTLELFTKETGNTKLAKSRESPYQAIGLFLSPHRDNSLGVNLCPFASASCVAACLNISGLASVFPKILEARRRKTEMYLADRSGFIEKIKAEIVVYERRAKKNKRQLVVRLNGTSDIDYSRSGIFETFPQVQFYDYTKSPYMMKRFLDGNLASNYHLTFSHSGDTENLEHCKQTLARGGNVAVVFDSASFPSKFLGYPIKTGEETDLRFLDGRGQVIALKAKGKAKKDSVGGSFVIHIDRMKGV